MCLISEFALESTVLGRGEMGFSSSLPCASMDFAYQIGGLLWDVR